LSIRENLVKKNDSQVAPWLIANCQSMLGESLMAQQKPDEAEPLLTVGYSGLVENESSIPLQARSNLHEGARRLKELYLLLEKPDEVAKFEKEMERWKFDEK
jgi:hypothetical protein